MVRLREIHIRENLTEEEVFHKAIQKYKISESSVKTWRVFHKSIDARNKQDVHFVYTFDVELKEEEKNNIATQHMLYQKVEDAIMPEVIVRRRSKYRPVVIGAGPAGLFAALTMAEHGILPIVVEQGKRVEERIQDVEVFKKTGTLNVFSNIQFGEGGAGTFSDGKLNSGIHSPYCKSVLETFVKMGAPNSILYMHKPHVGTDHLVQVVQAMREEIIRLGGTFLFHEKVIDFEWEKNQLKAIICSGIVNQNKSEWITIDTSEMKNSVLQEKNNYRILTDTAVLAIGHSSRDTFEKLYELGIKMEAKSFSVGARIEHQQECINKAQYGEQTKLQLPAAEYKLVSHGKERTLYTFCMCPGGVVVPSTSEENAVVTNGMSYFARDLENANSAILVGVNPEDFAGDHPLRGMYFQRELEHKAFEVGGGNYKAPAQRVEDFLAKRKTNHWGKVKPSYLPGVTMADLHEVLPPFITDTMEEGIVSFDRKLKGFADKDAVLTGVETRSSSPVRIVRNENLESNIQGIYPCGEGPGYAGGIMSAAVDGIKIAMQILEKEEEAKEER